MQPNINKPGTSAAGWLSRGPRYWNRKTLEAALACAIPVGLFWLIVGLRIPYSVSRLLSTYSPGLFVVVLAAYCMIFRAKDRTELFAGLMFTMVLFGLTISFQRTSGYTDTAMIGGLLPYKDAKNYYHGAIQILTGLPLRYGIQAVRRPLFPGLLASLLFLVGGNLPIVLALLAQLTGLSLYGSARVVRNAFGPWAAGLYTCLMYFYIQPKAGYSVSELPGFMLGCWAFSIVWISARRGSWLGLIAGVATMMAAISMRAGAFLIFPMLVVWAGWIFRGAGRFSVKAAAAMAAVVLVLYLLENQAFSALLDIPAGDQWGSFAYAMYGQVHGGTGWHSAIEDLQTTRTSVVADETVRFFVAHPLSFVVAAAKSYRDFFLPGPFTVFAFGSVEEPAWVTYALWGATMALLIVGLTISLRNLHSNLASLLVAGFVGTLLSIPFLPPIDSGARFHAGSIGFLFILPAVPLARPMDWLKRPIEGAEGMRNDLRVAAGLSMAALALTLVVPLGISRLTAQAVVTTPTCPAGQKPFAMRVPPATYVDLLPAADRRCGLLPEICLTDFDSHATDKTNDDFIQTLLTLAASSPEGMRITGAMNLLDARFLYFVEPIGKGLAAPAGQLVSGCAADIITKNETLYRIESLTTAGR